MKSIKRNLTCNRSFSYYYFYFILFRFFGLAPFHLTTTKIHVINNTENQQSVIFRTSYFPIIYNIFLIIITCLINALAIPYVYSADDGGAVASTWILGYTFAFVANTLLIIVWLYFIFYQKNAIEIINRVIFANIAITKCNCYISNNGNFDLILFTGNFIICIYLCVIDITTSVSHLYLVYYIPIFICRWVLTEYMIVWTLILQKFKNLNETLRKFGPVTANIDFNILFVTKIPLKKTIITDIIIIRRAHRILCEICYDISKFFGLPILLIVIYSSVCCICSSFYIVLTFVTHNPSVTIVTRINSTSWLMTELFFLILVTNSVTAITKEVWIIITSISFNI